MSGPFINTGLNNLAKTTLDRLNATWTNGNWSLDIQKLETVLSN
jgi:hypothetical protein